MMALDVQNVSHAFGPARVLKDVSFALASGQFAVLLGPNGAGKTTLFSLITRLYDARQGRITVLGHDLGRESTAALARMGVLFQQTTLDLDLTVAENLRYHAALHGFSRSEGWSRAKTALARMEVLDRQHQVVRSLSGGEKRRVEIARALLHDPKILLFDEPTVGLDPASRRAILVHVRALCGEAGITVLWATHLLDEVAADDHAILLEKGAVVGNGKASDLGLGRSSDLGPDRAT